MDFPKLDCSTSSNNNSTNTGPIDKFFTKNCNYFSWATRWNHSFLSKPPLKGCFGTLKLSGHVHQPVLYCHRILTMQHKKFIVTYIFLVFFYLDGSDFPFYFCCLSMLAKLNLHQSFILSRFPLQFQFLSPWMDGQLTQTKFQDNFQSNTGLHKIGNITFRLYPRGLYRSAELNILLLESLIHCDKH